MGKKYISWVIKAIAAGIIALGILSLFSLFYYNPPVHVPNETGATSYTREPDQFWSRGTEGFARGTTDATGFNNSYPAENKEISILMMGSSQTEGLYVNEDECASYLLNQKFDENDLDLYVYNIGMSAHPFYQNINHLEQALQQYAPGKYVLIETSTLSCTWPETEAAINHTMQEPEAYDRNSFIYYVQKNPYVKLLYQQAKNYTNQDTETVSTDTADDLTVGDSYYATDAILNYTKEICDAYQCQPLIYYIPSVSIGEDGTISHAATNDTRQLYQDLCQEKGILFADLTESIDKAYLEDHIIASGFSNTTIGYGHLNSKGHEILCDEIYRIILEKEADR